MQSVDSFTSRLEAGIKSCLPGLSEPVDVQRMAPTIMVPMHLAVDSAPMLLSVAANAKPAGLLKVLEDDVLGLLSVDDIAVCSRQAAELGIAPELLAYDSGAGALLYSVLPDVEWRSVSRGDLDADEVLSVVLTVKSEWHQSASLPVTRSPFDLIDLYIEAAANAGVAEAVEAGARAVREFMPWMTRFREAFAAAGHDVAPTHGENALTNIFLSEGGSARLVDFDRAVNADPLYDLAGFALEIVSLDEDLDRLAALYGAGLQASECARLKVYMIVDDFQWGLWALIAHFTSPRSKSVEFYKYAQFRFARCRYWLHRWDIAALLRQF